MKCVQNLWKKDRLKKANLVLSGNKRVSPEWSQFIEISCGFPSTLGQCGENNSVVFKNDTEVFLRGGLWDKCVVLEVERGEVKVSETRQKFGLIFVGQ